MRPYHHFAPATVEVIDQRLQSLAHVFVAQVPGSIATAEHGAIITFRIRHQTCILFGIKKFIRRDVSIAASISVIAWLRYDLNPLS